MANEVSKKPATGLQAFNQTITNPSTQKYLADVNDDGVIDILDAAEIQMYVAGKITEFKKKA